MVASEEFLYLTTAGWKSGKPHEVEVWFVENQGKYYVVSELNRRAHWVQNIEHNSSISFKVAGKKLKGSARILSMKADSERIAGVSRLMERKYQWSDGLIVELDPRT